MKLCAHRHELPSDADVFFWSGKAACSTGSAASTASATRWKRSCSAACATIPACRSRWRSAATAHQLTRVATGEGVVNTIWHTYWAVGAFTPSVAADMQAARQQHGELRFGKINRIHQPVAFASMLLLLGMIALGWRREAFNDLGLLAATVTAALLANAFVCGVLSNPHDRYGARLVWIAPLAVVLLLCRLYVRAGRTARPRARYRRTHAARLGPSGTFANPASTSSHSYFRRIGNATNPHPSRGHSGSTCVPS